LRPFIPLRNILQSLPQGFGARRTISLLKVYTLRAKACILTRLLQDLYERVKSTTAQQWRRYAASLMAVR